MRAQARVEGMMRTSFVCSRCGSTYHENTGGAVVACEQHCGYLALICEACGMHTAAGRRHWDRHASNLGAAHAAAKARAKRHARHAHV